MDLLPYPPDPVQPSLAIEFICEDLNSEWENIGSFDVKSEWTKWKDRLQQIKIRLSQSDVLTAAKLLQAVAYFGFLAGFLGTAFRVDDFVNGSYSVSLLHLRRLLSRVSRDTWANVDMQVLSSVDIDSTLPCSGGPTCLLCKVCLSLRVLRACCTSVSIEDLSDTKQIMQSRMLSAGWCPYWTKIWTNRTSYIPYLHYASAIKYPADSSHCTIDSCRCNNVIFDEYRTKHASSCQSDDCDFAGVQTDFISEIIKAGGVPLLKLTREWCRGPDALREAYAESLTRGFIQNGCWATDDCLYKMDIVEYTPDIDYLAISHVWSGGLGNFRENKLPQCQLEYIYRSVLDCEQRGFDHDFRQPEVDSSESDDTVDVFRGLTERMIRPLYKLIPQFLRRSKVSGPLYVWIDTLCIPVADGTAECAQAKQDAIDKMRFIYTSAAHVLVIDPVIRELRLEDHDDVDIAVQLSMSSWLTRCWTFQEALLARRLSFSFLESTMNPQRWRASIEKGRSLSPQLDRSIFEGINWQEKMIKALALDSLECPPQVVEVKTRASGMSSLVEIVFGRPFDRFFDPPDYARSSFDQAQTFSQTWNELAQRTTTLKSDVPGILATATGLSPRQPVAGNSTPQDLEFRRMKAILKSLKMIPISMLIDQFPPDTNLCPVDRWVPAHPAGQIFAGDHRYVGWEDNLFMTWTEDGSGLRLPHRKEDRSGIPSPFSQDRPKIEAFLVSQASYGRFANHFNISSSRSTTNDGGAVAMRRGTLWRTFFGAEWHHCDLLGSAIGPEVEGKDWCVILYTTPTLESGRKGALFTVSSHSDGSLRLRFCCPLLHHVGHRAGSPTYVASRLAQGTECILECDADQWETGSLPSTRWMTQTSFKDAIIIFLAIYWAAASFYLRYDQMLSDDPSDFGWLPASIANFCASSAKVMQNFAQSFIGKVMWMALLPLYRNIFFIFIDGPALDRGINKHRRRMFARNVDHSAGATPRIRPWYARVRSRGEDLLIQYPTLWSMTIPLLVVGLWAAGGPVYLISRIWSSDVPTENFTAIRRFAVVFSGETFLRVIGELVYWKFWTNGL